MSLAPRRASSARPSPSRFSARRAWSSVHLWLGLAIGFWLSLIGVTGSILVFSDELDEWLNPSLRVVAGRPGGSSAYAPFEAIRAASDSVVPKGDKSWLAVYPRHDRGAYQFFYFSRRAGNRLEIRHVFVDPYTAAVTGTRVVKSADQLVPRVFIPFVLNLHYNLLLFEAGTTITGMIAILGLLSLISGLYLWWPRNGQVAHAIMIKRHASIARRIFDIHKTTAVVSVAVICTLFVSGISFNLPKQFTWVVERFSEVTSRHWMHSTVPENGEPISPTAAMRIADDNTPGGRMQWIYLPDSPNGIYTFCKHGLVAINRFVDRRCITIDQYSGKVLHLDDVVSGSNGDAFLAWQWPLHSGQAFGPLGRIIVLFTGLALPTLFVTGVLRWLLKRRVRQQGRILRTD